MIKEYRVELKEYKKKLKKAEVSRQDYRECVKTYVRWRKNCRKWEKEQNKRLKLTPAEQLEFLFKNGIGSPYSCGHPLVPSKPVKIDENTLKSLEQFVDISEQIVVISDNIIKIS